MTAAKDPASFRRWSRDPARQQIVLSMHRDGETSTAIEFAEWMPGWSAKGDRLLALARDAMNRVIEDASG